MPTATSPSPAADASPLMTAEEAAQFLRTTEGTLAVWRCKGTYALPFVRRGRKVFYRLRRPCSLCGEPQACARGGSPPRKGSPESPRP